MILRCHGYFFDAAICDAAMLIYAYGASFRHCLFTLAASYLWRYFGWRDAYAPHAAATITR